MQDSTTYPPPAPVAVKLPASLASGRLIVSLWEAWANEHDKVIFDRGDRAAYRRWVGDLDYMKQLFNAGAYEALARIITVASENTIRGDDHEDH